MQLSFDAVALENFRSFRKRQELVFADLPHGAFFIQGINKANPALGSNGAGKSTLFDAILWALTGKTLRGLRATDVRTWGANGPTIVELTFSIDDARHMVKRQASPNSLELDGREVSDHEVERLIGIPFSIIPHTILIGQGQDLFFDLAPKAKMQLFTDVLKLDRWDHRSEVAKERADGYVSEINTLDGAITQLEQTLPAYQANLKRMQDESATWEETRATALVQSEQLFKQADKRLQALITAQGKGTLMVDGAETELQAIEAELAEARKAVRVRDERMKAKAIDIATREVAIKAHQTQLKAMLGKVCPTCGQKISPTHDSVKDLQHTLDIDQTALYEVMQSRDATERKREALNVLVATLEDARHGYMTRRREGQSIIDQHAQEIATITAQKQALERETRALERSDNPHAIHAETIRKQIAKVQSDLDDKTDRRDRLHKRVARYRYWQKGFREIKLYVIDEILQEMQLASNAMLEEFGLDGWRIVFEVERETQAGNVTRGLNIFIHSPDNDKAVKWEVWSGGEGQRLRIIGALSLAEVLLNHAGVVPSLEVLDEPTRSMSANGARDLCEFLADRAKRLRRRVFLIDHLSRESARFAGRLVVQRSGRSGSRLDLSGMPALAAADRA